VGEADDAILVKPGNDALVCRCGEHSVPAEALKLVEGVA
jgi:hypothetical protein